MTPEFCSLIRENAHNSIMGAKTTLQSQESGGRWPGQGFHFWLSLDALCPIQAAWFAAWVGKHEPCAGFDHNLSAAPSEIADGKDGWLSVAVSHSSTIRLWMNGANGFLVIL